MGEVSREPVTGFKPILSIRSHSDKFVKEPRPGETSHRLE